MIIMLSFANIKYYIFCKYKFYICWEFKKKNKRKLETTTTNLMKTTVINL